MCVSGGGVGRGMHFLWDSGMLVPLLTRAAYSIASISLPPVAGPKSVTPRPRMLEYALHNICENDSSGSRLRGDICQLHFHQGTGGGLGGSRDPEPLPLTQSLERCRHLGNRKKVCCPCIVRCAGTLRNFSRFETLN